MRRTAELMDVALELTPTEFDLLVALARAGGAAVPTGELYRSAWHEDPLPSSRNSVMVYIRRLRRKLAAVDPASEHIVTVWGVGYRLATGVCNTKHPLPPETEGSSC